MFVSSIDITQTRHRRYGGLISSNDNIGWNDKSNGMFAGKTKSRFRHHYVGRHHIVGRHHLVERHHIVGRHYLVADITLSAGTTPPC